MVFFKNKKELEEYSKKVQEEKEKKETEEEIKDIHKSGLSFFKWIQEFSKKIVSITFVMFVIINVFILVSILISYFQTGDLMYIDTLIMEANQTFREVIGGYIIKSAAENAIKIAGSIAEKYFEHYFEYKIQTSSYNEEDPMEN